MGAIDNNLQTLIGELRTAVTGMSKRDQKTADRIDTLEQSINEILVGQRRPGRDFDADGSDEHKSLVAMCLDRKSWSSQKYEGRAVDYSPGSDELDEARGAHKAFKALLRNGGDYRRLDPYQQKSLSAFSFSGSGWALPQTFSNRVLSCLTDPTDILSLLAQETISGASIVFPLDNSELDGIGWACEESCDGPIGSLPPPGQIEIKPETLRMRICATSDLLEDASFSVERWLMRKVARAVRQKLAEAFICGDGIGRPQGILHGGSGIPVCDVSPSTPPDQFQWQDLVALKYQLPEQYAARGTFLMNAQTLGLLLSMSDAMGRPIWSAFPSELGGAVTVAGSPVRVVSQMPNVAAGSTPVLFADLEALYQVVHRRGLTFSTEPAGWCSVFKFSQRIGGAVICPGAGRLLRIN